MDDLQPSDPLEEPPAVAPAAEAGAPLTLGHILTSLGAVHDPPLRLEDMHVIRHVFRPGDPGQLQGYEDVTEARVFDVTRWQGSSLQSIPANPPPYWVVLIADGQRRSRFFRTYENRGMSPTEDGGRIFDLRPSAFLSPLSRRLVVEWGKDFRRWGRTATSAAKYPVLEIADRDTEPFPGFDQVRLTYRELCDMVEENRYADWRVALKSVQGIYLITDSTNGKQYVGKADGAERILGRWSAYARDGHGGNVALRELAYESTGEDPVKTDHARHFVFSLLRVFGPSTSSTEVDAAEAHYKQALMTREHGLNRN